MCHEWVHKLQTSKITNMLPEDGQQLRPKDVGAIIIKKKALCNKLALNIMYVLIDIYRALRRTRMRNYDNWLIR